jgi:hypothetical protein
MCYAKITQPYKHYLDRSWLWLLKIMAMSSIWYL